MTPTRRDRGGLDVQGLLVIVVLVVLILILIQHI